jgi:hypothetical protein
MSEEGKGVCIIFIFALLAIIVLLIYGLKDYDNRLVYSFNQTLKQVYIGEPIQEVLDKFAVKEDWDKKTYGDIDLYILGVNKIYIMAKDGKVVSKDSKEKRQ